MSCIVYIQSSNTYNDFISLSITLSPALQNISSGHGILGPSLTIGLFPMSKKDKMN